jgi:hypothetical protein
MIVGNQDSARAQFDRALNDFAGINWRMVDCAALKHFVSDQVVALIQEQHTELLAGIHKRQMSAPQTNLLVTQHPPTIVSLPCWISATLRRYAQALASASAHFSE